MGKPTNGELEIMLKNISDNVDKGFKGVHDRQDITNGSVIKNTEYRIKSKATISTFKYLISIFGIGTIINVFINLTNIFK